MWTAGRGRRFHYRAVKDVRGRGDQGGKPSVCAHRLLVDGDCNVMSTRFRVIGVYERREHLVARPSESARDGSEVLEASVLSSILDGGLLV